MLLVVDTSVLVGDLLRTRGRERLNDHRLNLYLPEHTVGEVHVELPRRIGAVAASAGLAAAERDDLLMLCLDAVDNNLAVVAAEVYAPFEEEALARSQRDPRRLARRGVCAGAERGGVDERQRLPGHGRPHVDHPDPPDLAESTALSLNPPAVRGRGC